MDVYKPRWSIQLLLDLLPAEIEAFEAQGRLERRNPPPPPPVLAEAPANYQVCLGLQMSALEKKSALGFKCFDLSRQEELDGPPQLVYIHARSVLAVGHD